MTALQTAAQAVLDRWNNSKWDWHKQGPTGDLMYDLRMALDQQSELDKVDQQLAAASISADGGSE